MAIKKEWYEIVAPKFLGEAVVGETLTANPKILKGRTVEVSLMDITNDFSKFYIKLKLQVTDIDGKRLYTKFVGHDILKEKIYRMVLRRRRRVDSIDLVHTKDGKTVRIKTIAIVLRRTKTAIKDAVRAKISQMVKEAAEKHTIEELIKSVLDSELQRHLRDELKKIYPVGQVEIRKSEIIEKAKKKHLYEPKVLEIKEAEERTNEEGSEEKGEISESGQGEQKEETGQEITEEKEKKTEDTGQ